MKPGSRKTIPAAEVLETEDFGTDFQVCFLTKRPAEEIKELISGISEVENVEISAGAPLKTAEKPQAAEPVKEAPG
ncbi:hypothetical protein QNN00_19580 [Bacillus velezensis]|nr:hypothetical protein [Bacillus velezensis]